MSEGRSAEVARLASVLRKQLLLVPPVNLQAVCDSLKIRVVTARLPADFPGVYTNGPECPSIALNSRDSIGRRRFTWAHEIGHHFIGVGGGPDQERMCNCFAVELLMPEQLFRDRVLSLRGVHPQRMVALIARTFGVSLEAVLHRLDELDLWDAWYQSAAG